MSIMSSCWWRFYFLAHFHAAAMFFVTRKRWELKEWLLNSGGKPVPELWELVFSTTTTPVKPVKAALWWFKGPVKAVVWFKDGLTPAEPVQFGLTNGQQSQILDVPGLLCRSEPRRTGSPDCCQALCGGLDVWACWEFLHFLSFFFVFFTIKSSLHFQTIIMK